MSSWWTTPYRGGGPAVTKGFPRPLYPPDAQAKGKTPSVDGPDVVAYKRTICKLGRWNPWDPTVWDDSFSNAFSHGRGTGMVGDSGVAGFQRQMKIQPTGWIGQNTFDSLRYALVPTGPHMGEQAMDSVAVEMINDAWEMFQGKPTPKPPPADAEQLVKDAIADYCKRSISSEPKIHYSQNRPMTHLGVAPEDGFTCDCSGHSTGAYYWAKLKTLIQVPDPNHCGYNGYGYTGTLVDNPQVTSGNYVIGDLGIYGTSTSNTTHVVTCYQAGDAVTAKWCSHGSEAGPYQVALLYRYDLVKVVRPGLLP